MNPTVCLLRVLCVLGGVLQRHVRRAPGGPKEHRVLRPPRQRQRPGHPQGQHHHFQLYFLREAAKKFFNGLNPPPHLELNGRLKRQ